MLLPEVVVVPELVEEVVVGDDAKPRSLDGCAVICAVVGVEEVCGEDEVVDESVAVPVLWVPELGADRWVVAAAELLAVAERWGSLSLEAISRAPLESRFVGAGLALELCRDGD